MNACYVYNAWNICNVFDNGMDLMNVIDIMCGFDLKYVMYVIKALLFMFVMYIMYTLYG